MKSGCRDVGFGLYLTIDAIVLHIIQQSAENFILFDFQIRFSISFLCIFLVTSLLLLSNLFYRTERITNILGERIKFFRVEDSELISQYSFPGANTPLWPPVATKGLHYHLGIYEAVNQNQSLNINQTEE